MVGEWAGGVVDGRGCVPMRYMAGAADAYRVWTGWCTLSDVSVPYVSSALCLSPPNDGMKKKRARPLTPSDRPSLFVGEDQGLIIMMGKARVDFSLGRFGGPRSFRVWEGGSGDAPDGLVTAAFAATWFVSTEGLSFLAGWDAEGLGVFFVCVLGRSYLNRSFERKNPLFGVCMTCAVRAPPSPPRRSGLAVAALAHPALTDR